MKGWSWVARLTCLVWPGLILADPEIITGAREWRMADGKSRRLKVVGLSPDGAHVYLHDGRSKGSIPPVAVESLAPEDRKILTELHAGRLALCKTPGVPTAPDMPVGKVADKGSLSPGAERQWTNTEGRSFRASLVNLTDDQIWLLNADTVVRVAVRDLSGEDREYLQKLLGGGRTPLPHEDIQVLSQGGDGRPSYTAGIPPERHASLAEMGSRFEVVLESVLAAVAEKLPKNSWEFLSLEEASLPRDSPDGETPWLYSATFLLKPEGHRAARLRWPLTTTPEGSAGDRELVLHLMADGEILETRKASHGK